MQGGRMVNEIKIYECALCKKFAHDNIRGFERVTGTRKEIRKHLANEHHIKGRKNKQGVTKKEFGPSEISVQTLSKKL
jgi:hypothetical protein